MYAISEFKNFDNFEEVEKIKSPENSSKRDGKNICLMIDTCIETDTGKYPFILVMSEKCSKGFSPRSHMILSIVGHSLDLPPSSLSVYSGIFMTI